MGHADFRVAGKIFATLGYPDDFHGTIMLSPLDQDLLLQRHAKAFKPAAGAWGKAGTTSVILKAAPTRVVALALDSAWSRRAPKQLAAERTARSSVRKGR
jgi:hypothetical protein